MKETTYESNSDSQHGALVQEHSQCASRETLANCEGTVAAILLLVVVHSIVDPDTINLQCKHRS
ncbi:hypothetical protein D3C80_2162630 [compost metagenome]